MARAFDRPIQLIPARYSALRAIMHALQFGILGWTAKSLANHKSNLKAALFWFEKKEGGPRYGTPLTPEWQLLHAALSNPSSRTRLAPLMRYCSALSITPEQVDEGVVDRFFAYRASHTSLKVTPAVRRVLARLWNKNVGIVPGWPSCRLKAPARIASTAPAWTDFPAGLRADVDEELVRLSLRRDAHDGTRLRAAKPSTIATRRRELSLLARRAIRAGTPIHTLTSLDALLHPDVIIPVIDTMWRDNGEEPKAFTIDLAWRVFGIARRRGLPEGQVAALREIAETLAEYRETGITEKNLDVIRQVLTRGVWSNVVGLPAKLMQEARARHRDAPVRAAVLAQLAVAIAILSSAPVRLANLTAIKLGENLTKPGGPESEFLLTFARYDVKNRMPVEFPLTPRVTAIINEYVHEFRPELMRGRKHDQLFPGVARDTKEKISFSTQIVRAIAKGAGIRVTVHQFRHAAGALILKRYPGDYERVRRVLGHKNIETTIRFYCELDFRWANEEFGKIVEEQLPAELLGRSARRRRKKTLPKSTSAASAPSRRVRRRVQ